MEGEQNFEKEAKHEANKLVLDLANELSGLSKDDRQFGAKVGNDLDDGNNLTLDGDRDLGGVGDILDGGDGGVDNGSVLLDRFKGGADLAADILTARAGVEGKADGGNVDIGDRGNLNVQSVTDIESKANRDVDVGDGGNLDVQSVAGVDSEANRDIDVGDGGDLDVESVAGVDSKANGDVDVSDRGNLDVESVAGIDSKTNGDVDVSDGGDFDVQSIAGVQTKANLGNVDVGNGRNFDVQCLAGVERKTDGGDVHIGDGRKGDVQRRSGGGCEDCRDGSEAKVVEAHVDGWITQ